jgi:microcompartment protein CcmL/EutN
MRPALGLLELGSIAAGVRAGDAMVKRAPVAALYAGTVHPGRYLLLVGGEVAAVEEALAAGRESGAASLYDEILIPDVHPQVVAALTGARQPGEGDAVGVVETATVAALLGAADRGVKAAEVTLRELRLADDLGGKSYCMFRGAQADVEAAVERACEGLAPELLVGRVVVPRLHDEMLANLDAATGFGARVRTAPGEG